MYIVCVGAAFEVDDPIIYATGVIRERDSMAETEDVTHVYSMDASGAVGFDLDMSGERANLVKYINSGGRVSTSNCCIKWHGMAVAVVYCTRGIHVGEELLADYPIL